MANHNAALAIIQRINEIGEYPYWIEISDSDLVAAVTALAVPSYWDKELALKVLTDFLGFPPEKAGALFPDVRRVIFVHTSEPPNFKLGKSAREFFLTRAREQLENLEGLYKLLATHYQEKLSVQSDKNDFEYRELTLLLLRCELHFDLESAIDRLATFIGRAILYQRVASLWAVYNIIKEDVDTLGEGGERVVANLESLYQWSRQWSPVIKD